jgi:hypothetical protein
MNGAHIPFDGAQVSTLKGWAGSTRKVIVKMTIRVNVQIKIDAAKCLSALAAVLSVLA